jgi:cyclase
MKKTVLAALLASSMFTFSTAVVADSGVKWRTEKVSEHLYVLFGRGGNIAVHVGNDGVYIVDDQFANLSDEIKAQIKAIQPQLPEFVINTHFHGDHTGGNEAFAQSGSHVIAHNHVHKRLEDKHGAGSKMLPRLAFGSDLTLHFNNEHAFIKHFAHAHTDGDSVVFFPVANAIHFGDLFFNTGSLPFVDVDGGGSVDGLLAALKSIEKDLRASTVLIPGHGPVANKAALTNYILLIEKAKALIVEAMVKHQGEEAVVAADPLNALNLTYAGWLPKERVTRLFYRSLCAEQCAP